MWEEGVAKEKRIVEFAGASTAYTVPLSAFSLPFFNTCTSLKTLFPTFVFFVLFTLLLSLVTGLQPFYLCGISYFAIHINLLSTTSILSIS
jgi:hypothetical protein